MSCYRFSESGNKRIAAIPAEVENRPDVKGIVLKIDTLGGTVHRTDLLAEAVKNFSKPIVAWTNYRTIIIRMSLLKKDICQTAYRQIVIPVAV